MPVEEFCDGGGHGGHRRYFTPPLTTVRQDFDALGRDAMAGVLAVLGDADRLMPAPTVPELIVRTSTSAPSRDRVELSS